LVRARQTGYEASSGDLVANVDADTLLPQGWIQTVMDEFSRDPQLVALSGPYVYYDLSPFLNAVIRFWYRMGTAVSFIHSLVTGRSGTMLQGGNFILRRSALEKAGGFDLNFDFYGEDTAIAKRMSSQGKVKFSFLLLMYTSGRRLQEEGILTIAGKYGMNFFWTIFFGKAYTKKYKDIRL
jgi:cellulose synthase/poly-beta-1,6-N-acetylglucosamine synthase-like glycosyltransferase